ncbi:C-type mannose receptor 2-like [Ctenopharyngodon idella]|uniref:C-type mannose receptor 2-like n=1 Tax=Ctenopharyngodon idella TaxID=7959 RepID=UPI0022322760|nr:C-type mannose receptor 2-like [Ctenopharyngodon idella]
MFTLLLLSGFISFSVSHRYVFVNESKTWAEAQRYCRDKYTDLATTENDQQTVQLINTVKDDSIDLAWIGLYDDLNSWKWTLEDSDFFKVTKPGLKLRVTAENITQTSSVSGMRLKTTGVILTSSRQYHFVNESKTWTEAQRYCRQNYTDLATIDNMEEMNSLINTVNGSYNGSAWIGLYDDVNSWRWSLEDNDFYQEGERDFRNWYHEPDNSSANATQNYIRIYDWKIWSKARRYCREHHTDLISIRNEAEIHEIQYLFKNEFHSFWIGLYRTRSWSDQSNSSFSNWRTGQPDNAGNSEYCTTVSFSDSGNWTDENCDTALPFICYSVSSLTSSRQYHVVSESKTWTEAQRYCRQNYTDLATIDNMEEMNRLINTVNGSYNGSAWIGLYGDVNSWRWSLEDNDFYQEGKRDFRNFYHQPDNYDGKELCVSIYYGLTENWFDSSCDNHYTFVCYDGRTFNFNSKTYLYQSLKASACFLRMWERQCKALSTNK